MNQLHTHGRWGERLISSSWRWILFPLWVCYRPLIGLRNLAYDRQWKKSRRLSVPVISIGNIIVGGSGKTPMVQKICDLLRQATSDTQVHVLSRGYKSDNASGDNEEAALLSAPVHCNSQRYASGKKAIAAGAQMLVMDDGFQHRQLHRDLDIVLIDSTRPWGWTSAATGAVLPLGFLRESMRALNRANVIILTRCQQSTAQRIQYIQNILARIAPHCNVLRTQHAASHYSALDDNTPLPLDHFSEKKVVLISGIAHPQSFSESVCALGADIVAHHTFPDHHHFNRKDLESLQQLYRGQDVSLLCTSKDAIKLAKLWQQLWPQLNNTDADTGTATHEHSTLSDIKPCCVLHIGIEFYDNDEATLIESLNTL